MSRASLATPAVLAIALIGCAHRLVVEPAMPASSPPVQRIPALLVVQEVELIRGARYAEASDGFVNRVVMELRRPRAFRSVLPPEAAPTAPHDAVWLRLALSETFDEHYGPNVARAVAVGLSLLTLAPFVRFDASYRAAIQGEVRTCDGWASHYASDARGTLSYGLFSNERQGRHALGAMVLERALRGVLDQVAGDAALAVRVGDLARNQDCPSSGEDR